MSTIKSRTNEDFLPPDEATISRLKIVYFSALALIAAVLIASSLLLQQAINKSGGDSRVINLAGRQRMLSQRLSKGVLALKIKCPTFDCPTQLQEISQSLDDWTRAHEGLQHGDRGLQLPQRENSREIKAAFLTLDVHHKAMVTAINSILEASSPKARQAHLDDAINVILQNEREFLGTMDQITFQFDKESKENLQSIAEIERFMLFVGLLILLLEFFLVFRPSLRNLSVLFRALSKRTDDLADANFKLHLQLEESARLRAEADSANRAKSAFLSNISHEIRTPLNSIIGFTELLEKRLFDSQSAEYLAPLKSAGFSLLNLINDVLDLSKIEAGKTEIRVLPVQIKELLHEIRNIFLEKIENKGLKFTLTTSETLPKTLLLDETKLRQILVNLIGNATKFTERGFIAVNVECGSCQNSPETPDRTELVITISDSGCGMSSEYQQKLFSPFHQEETTYTRKFVGTGLGLSIVKNLVQLMGGTISAQSTVDVGTTFLISIPNVEIVEPTESLNKHTATSTSHDQGLDFNFEAATILIADANPYDRLYLKSAFEVFPKLQIIEVEDGRGLLDAVQQQPIDLIITELRLTEIDGLEAAKQLRSNPRYTDIAIVLLTGSVFEMEQDDNAEAFGRIFDLRLRKPVLISEVLASLRMLLPHKLSTPPNVSRDLIKPTIESLYGNIDFSEHQPYWQNNIEPLLYKCNHSCSSDDVQELLEHLQAFNTKTGTGVFDSHIQKLHTAVKDFDLDEMTRVAKSLATYKQILFKS
jgi:signal transduction histidine kinase/CheY-like chemotaxis protein